MIRLQTWTRREGAIRLPTDDGPALHESLGDDYDAGDEDIADDEPLSLTAARLKAMRTQQAPVDRPSVPHSTNASVSAPHA